MSARVVVLDVGMGNLRSVARALARAGAIAEISADPSVVARAQRLVFPGQGHFGDCARALREGGRGEALREMIASGRPFLGICLGMQVLFDESDEAPGERGLGLVRGRVERIASQPGLKVPHMGWSQIAGEHALFGDERWFYFVHSYRCVPDARVASRAVAFAEHGGPVCAAIAWENVFACQFHPEKSQRAGAALLERWVSWS